MVFLLKAAVLEAGSSECWCGGVFRRRSLGRGGWVTWWVSYPLGGVSGSFVTWVVVLVRAWFSSPSLMSCLLYHVIAYGRMSTIVTSSTPTLSGGWTCLWNCELHKPFLLIYYRDSGSINSPVAMKGIKQLDLPVSCCYDLSKQMLSLVN